METDRDRLVKEMSYSDGVIWAGGWLLSAGGRLPPPVPRLPPYLVPHTSGMSWKMQSDGVLIWCHNLVSGSRFSIFHPLLCPCFEM